MRRFAVAALLAAAGILAPLVAPHDPDEIVDVMAARDLRPGSEIHVIARRDGTRFAARSVEMTDDALICERGDRRETIERRELAPGEPERRRFLLGTDAYGRDLLSRILYGARLSIGVTVLAVSLGLLIGVAAGAFTGYVGGAMDAGLMRLVDALHAIPRIFLFLLCAALFGPSAFLVGIVLGVTGWIGIARITRSHILSLRETGFTAAARALGANRRRVVLRHLLPNCAAPIAVATVLLAADTILTESSLSFIGLGVQPPAASWGSLIAAGRGSVLTAWWVVLFPGLAIVISVLLLHLVARPFTAPIPFLPGVARKLFPWSRHETLSGPPTGGIKS